MSPQKPEELTLNNISTWQWFGIALLAQMGWGAYPALLRYLQTISGIPSLSLLAVGNFIVLVIIVAFYWRRIDKRIFRLRIMWVFGAMVVLRGITNLLAARFTLATYVQLIYLMTPFIVALLSKMILREKLPNHTFKALTIALIGALLIMSGSLTNTAVSATISRNDPLGIALAIASTLFLALYMIITRRTTKYNAPGEALMVVHLISLCGFSAFASLLIGENWGQWLTLTPQDWAIFGLLSFGVLLGANMGQIRSIQQLGAPLVSSMMAIRLVSALFVASLLLGEQLSTGWQVLGTAVVIITITWYLRQQ